MIPSGGAPGLRADAELPRVPGAARSAWDSASRQASALGEATQADHFPERNIEVHDPDAADGAAHVKVVNTNADRRRRRQTCPSGQSRERSTGKSQSPGKPRQITLRRLCDTSDTREPA